MIRVILTKLHPSNDSVEGQAHTWPPEPGRSFIVQYDGSELGTRTSPVKGIIKVNPMVFILETFNSIYRVEAQ